MEITFSTTIRYTLQVNNSEIVKQFSTEHSLCKYFDIAHFFDNVKFRLK